MSVKVPARKARRLRIHSQPRAADMNREMANRLSPDVLIRLMESTGEHAGEWSLEEIGSIWSHQLLAPFEYESPVSTLNEGTGNTRHNRCVMGASSKVSQPAVEPASTALSAVSGAGLTYRGVLLKGEGSLMMLDLVKDFAKAHLIHEHSTLPRQIAFGLYYTAIAAAFVYHHTWITSLTADRIRYGLNWCLAQPWLDGDTRGLVQSVLGSMQNEPDLPAGSKSLSS